MEYGPFILPSTLLKVTCQLPREPPPTTRIVHPSKLTRNLKGGPWKRPVVSKGRLLRFDVSFPELRPHVVAVSWPLGEVLIS